MEIPEGIVDGLSFTPLSCARWKHAAFFFFLQGLKHWIFYLWDFALTFEKETSCEMNSVDYVRHCLKMSSQPSFALTWMEATNRPSQLREVNWCHINKFWIGLDCIAPITLPKISDLTAALRKNAPHLWCQLACIAHCLGLFITNSVLEPSLINLELNGSIILTDINLELNGSIILTEIIYHLREIITSISSESISLD